MRHHNIKGYKMSEQVFVLRGFDLGEAVEDLCLQRLRYLLKDDFIVEVLQEEVHPNDIKEVKDAVALVIKYLDWAAPDFDGRGYVEWYDKEPEVDVNKSLSVSLDMYHMFVITTALHRMKRDLLDGCQMNGTDELLDIIDDTRKTIRAKQLGLIDYFDDYPDAYNKILKDIDLLREGIK
jgi:hypothetical protein